MSPVEFQSVEQMLFVACYQILRNAADAEDAVQQALLRYLEVTRQPALVPIENPAAWMRQVARHIAISMRRGDRSAASEHLDATPDRTPTVEERLLLAEDICRVRREIAGLPKPIRDVVVLRHVRQLKLSAIARRLNLSLSTVHSRSQLGLTMLRERMLATAA